MRKEKPEGENIHTHPVHAHRQYRTNAELCELHYKKVAFHFEIYGGQIDIILTVPMVGLNFKYHHSECCR